MVRLFFQKCGFPPKGKGFLLSVCLCGIFGIFLSSASGYAASYVALFPSSPEGSFFERTARLGALLESNNLTAQTEDTLPHLQGALLELDASRREELLKNLPGTVLIPSSRTFSPCTEKETPKASGTPEDSVPWHVLWARNAGLTEGISSYAWGTVIVAVMDTGVNPHTDFAEAALRWDLGYNSITGASGTADAVYDDQGHGTTVTGTIVGTQTGVTPQVEVIPVKCADAAGYSSTADLARSVDYLLGLLSGSLSNRHLICNFSFATSGSALYRDEEMEAFFISLFDRIADAGGLFLSAAGNESTNVNEYYVYPSRISSSIFLSVAGTTETGYLATAFSNYGTKTIDIAAPGNAILTTLRDGESLKAVNGTSFACPIAAAAAAALWAREQHLSNWQVRNVLLNAVDSPLWISREASPSASVAVISGGDMAAEKLRDTSFVASSKGTSPKALDLIDPASGGLGGGCSVGKTLPGILLLFPLLSFMLKRSGS